MKLYNLLIPALVFGAVTTSLSQDKNSNNSYPDEEIPFIVRDGVKWDAKNNTPLTFVGIRDAVTGNSPEALALDWIEKNKESLKLDKTENLVPYFQHSGPAGHTVRFQQYFEGVPVFHSEIVVHVSPKNEVTHVSNTYDPSVEGINVVPGISQADALALAINAIDAKLNEHSYTEQQLMIENRSASALIYKVTVEPESPLGSWEIMVDAQSGEILKTANKTCNHGDHGHDSNMGMLPPPPPPVDGTGTIFDPDPLSVDQAAYGGSYADNNDATNATFDATMSSVTLLDIDETGGIYSLVGPFAEVTDHENPSNGTFSQASSAFNFSRDDDAFEAVNCYYHLDKSMRYINTTLNITCMPYQYSGGVQYDPSGWNGADNSSYSGGSGRLSFGEGGVDDGEDADVILHELGHGIHDWITGGNLSQVDGLSEGSGDYWAMSYSRSLNQWQPSDPEYNWMFSWDGHNPFWGGRITNYTASYPGGLTGSIHTDGQIWATTLMRIYDVVGRTKVDAAFLEGLAMTGSSTSQEDAAIAVRQAAIDLGCTCAEVEVFTNEFEATGYNMPNLNIPSSTINDAICVGDSVVVNGVTYNAGNPTGTQVFTDTAGVCDSIVIIDLTVNSVDINVTNNSPSLTADQSGATYQWVDCDNGNAAINGETSQTFTATSNGNYAVEVTVGNCTETSACASVDNVGIEAIELSKIEVYPNPSEGVFTLDFGSNSSPIQYSVVTVDGKMVRSTRTTQLNSTTVDLSDESKGVYFLNLEQKGETRVIQLLLK